MTVWRRLSRLFVDDGAVAWVVLAWIALSMLLRQTAISAAAANTLLAIGLPLLFSAGVVRAARKRRRA